MVVFDKMLQVLDLAGWRTSRKGLTFHLKIDFHICMGSIKIDMAEPVFDYSEIDPRLEQMHSRRVAERMGAHFLFSETGTLLRGGRNSCPDYIAHAEPR